MKQGQGGPSPWQFLAGCTVAPELPVLLLRTLLGSCISWLAWSLSSAELLGVHGTGQTGGL